MEKKRIKERKRILFLRWLSKLVKVEEGVLPPQWIQVIGYILFPLRSLGLKYSTIKWQPWNNLYTIEGLKIHGEVFHILGREAKEGFIFKLIKRESSGVITIEEIGTKFLSIDTTSSEFIKLMYKKMIVSQERAGGSSSFGDTLYVVWPGVWIGGQSASTKEVMEYLIQNNK